MLSAAIRFPTRGREYRRHAASGKSNVPPPRGSAANSDSRPIPAAACRERKLSVWRSSSHASRPQWARLPDGPRRGRRRQRSQSPGLAERVIAKQQAPKPRPDVVFARSPARQRLSNALPAYLLAPDLLDQLLLFLPPLRPAACFCARLPPLPPPLLLRLRLEPWSDPPRWPTCSTSRAHWRSPQHATCSSPSCAAPRTACRP